MLTIIPHFSDVFSHDLRAAVISAWKTVSVTNMVAQHGRLVTSGAYANTRETYTITPGRPKAFGGAELRIFNVQHLDS